MKSLFTTLVCIFITMAGILGQAPPSPEAPPSPDSNQSNSSNQTGAPIGGGAAILITMAVAYGGRKVYQSIGEKNRETA